jgi:SAM-dependent MidA family methyltransferase
VRDQFIITLSNNMFDAIQIRVFVSRYVHLHGRKAKLPHTGRLACARQQLTTHPLTDDFVVGWW